jgi:hypothetical protein
VSSEQLVLHVLAYAEVLFRWKLLHKRIELLKAVDPFLRSLPDWSLDFDHSQLGRPFAFDFLCYPFPKSVDCQTGVSILCTQCGESTASRTQSSCSACGTRLSMPRCSVCRLPVKGTSLVSSVPHRFVLMQQPLLGLSFHCLGCHHVSHLSCWRSYQSATCTTGCSCHCRAMV